YDDWREDAAFLHPYPGTVSVTFGREGEPTRGKITMRVEKVIETQDLLEMVGVPSPLARLVHRTLSKPYYFRWLSHVEGELLVEGEPVFVDERTIHEQMLFRGRRPREMMRSR
ncbi:MAG: hypothetical protein ACYC99_12320, partial [Candidatus Geothermincolia bacterium]